MRLRYQVRGYYFANNHRHFEVFANCATFDEAMDLVEGMRDDERAMAMFADFYVVEIF